MTNVYTRAEIQNQVLILTINRPEVRNALNPAAHNELARHFDAFEADPSLRVAIITGEGDRAFCAGSDIRESVDTALKPDSGFAGLSRRFERTKPVIAAVNGMALGGGLEIVLACDLAVAVDHSRFGLPEPRVGLAAIEGGLQRLVRHLPLKQAKQLLLTGEAIDAETALRFGLINEVVSADELLPSAMRLARAIIACSPVAIEATQVVVNSVLKTPDVSDELLWKHPAIDRLWASEDAKEGVAAFAGKRPPKWSGR